MNMGRAKLVLRIAGVATTAAGVTCFPVGYGINPKRDLSVFNNLADTGMFVTLGLILLAIGAVLLAASSLLRGAEPPDHV
jgi:hypothetical protein